MFVPLTRSKRLRRHCVPRKIPGTRHLITGFFMSNFIPDLNDPRTRGWGGHEYEYDYGDDRGYFIFSWLGFIVLFALPFT